MEFLTETEKLVYDCIYPAIKFSNLNDKKTRQLIKESHIVFMQYMNFGLEQEVALGLIKLAISTDKISKVSKEEIRRIKDEALILFKDLNLDPKREKVLLKNLVVAYCKIKSDDCFSYEEAFLNSFLEVFKINFGVKNESQIISQ